MSPLKIDGLFTLGFLVASRESWQFAGSLFAGACMQVRDGSLCAVC